MNNKKIITGIIGLSLLIQPFLINNNAYATSKIDTAKLLKVGMKGESVSSLQNKLKELGYFNNNITGYFGNVTKLSIEQFQKNNNLEVDGIAGEKTLNMLYEKSIGAPAVNRGTVDRISNWTWFNTITNIIEKGTSFKIIDVHTGKEFNAKRTYGTNHADTETLTKEDTLVMKSLFNNKWSWDRRPIVVQVNDIKIPGSMDGMPHGSDFIKDNDMEGHFDIHFLGSKTHGSNKVDPRHQEAVQIADKFLNEK